MCLADLHAHMTYSLDGTATFQDVLRHAAEEVGLQAIAITDHDEIRGALEAETLAPRHG